MWASIKFAVRRSKVMSNSVSMIDGHIDYSMTQQEALKIIETERKCVQEQISGSCDVCCSNCDLYIEDNKSVLLAYNIVISMASTQTPKKVIDKSKEYDGEYGRCPKCLHTVADYYDTRRCKHCNQALDWE